MVTIFTLHLIISGVRLITINKLEKLREILVNEIDYLEQCVEHPFGKFEFISIER